MNVWFNHVLVKFNTEKRAKTCPACLKAYGSGASLLYVSLGDGLVTSKIDKISKEKDVGFNIYKIL